MGYHKPIGTWEECWECSGKGWRIDKCYDCGRVNHDAEIEQCWRCKGVGFILQREWVREAHDPPPMTPREMTALFMDEMSKTLSSVFTEVWDGS